MVRAISRRLPHRPHHKDLNLALQGAAALKLSLPNTASTQQLCNAARAAGGGSWDHSGVVQVLERLGSHAVAGSPAAISQATT